ncbi:gamma-glutamyl-gamma-aminobutyrate hydrolase family protein [Pseudomonas sp. PDNC002]|uniref:CTP synthase C-terminal region-related (seleno)protein n=1 Tax=Pseudomonas sp. PDNC002 TaxID=2811422 RepID=UPI001963AE87|nr:gamma-glutamyl-gamma-aminobutyrate hydrolase family protein [Pseudomonas sp. PDNC002]QRY78103.1 gamma-glutamyl-gamma-aminobutyrate hydrolase family protein [Pseudomonas sp. PDNC002]
MAKRRKALRIGLIGDRDSRVTAHWAIPLALQQSLLPHSGTLRVDWLDTQRLAAGLPLEQYAGFWCIPGSPYLDTEGALRAITHARENEVPYLGTCAGFQHALLERARNVHGWRDAAHGELDMDSTRQVIHALPCSLVEVSETIRLASGSRLESIYGGATIREGYRCSYGVNPEFQQQLFGDSLRACAHGEDGSIRALEATDHPFFVATLFQPERKALAGIAVPLAEAFLCAAFQHATASVGSPA